MGKRSYNPLTMWGSWVGAAAPWLFLIITGLVDYGDYSSNFPSSEFAGIGWALLYLSTILGFLIGWGIHSYFRMAVSE